MNKRLLYTASAAVCMHLLSGSTFAEPQVLEEVIITARQQQETLQDVPVTVAAFNQEALDRYNISTLTEAADLIPNFQIYHGQSGSGSNIRLRGIGSSSISAAFDQSVAINVDGVVVNVGRFIHNAYMDTSSLEVLKGPQSVYFGKSATAGVISISSNDPGEALEIEAKIGYETEYDQTFTNIVISGPVTETLGARFAYGNTQSDELFKNLTPGVAKEVRGEESTNARLTLVYQPTDELKFRFKYAYSEYENDGSAGRGEEICAEASVQATTALENTVILPGVDDCKLNGNFSSADLNPALRAGLPFGADNGVPFLEQETDFFSLQVDYDINDNFALTSVTGYVDLDQKELDIYDYNVGLFGGVAQNIYESFSQEFRIVSNLESDFNFMAGFYYQDVEQQFNAFQYAANIGLVSPDPVTGNGYDYNKNHLLEGKVFSAFLATYWDVTDTIEITAGLRYTDEEKDGRITIPYVHTFLAARFSAPPVLDGLKFEDDNLSPELAINWYLTPEISVYGAYKEAFKSGGIDNSALPTAALSTTNPDFPEFLIYDSEQAKGFEFGVKARLLEGAMFVNASVYSYEYSDLQVQRFDPVAIQFETLNASELTAEGLEFDVMWATPIEGLTLRSAMAFTNTKYTDDFFVTGVNIKGEDRSSNADFAGNLGLSYDFQLLTAWRMNLSLDTRYNEGYNLDDTAAPVYQRSYWLTDAAVKLYSEDDHYELSVIGRNLGDETVAYGAGGRPGACPSSSNPAVACGTGPVDQIATTSLGRQLTMQFLVRF